MVPGLELGVPSKGREELWVSLIWDARLARGRLGGDVGQLAELLGTGGLGCAMFLHPFWLAMRSSYPRPGEAGAPRAQQIMHSPPPFFSRPPARGTEAACVTKPREQIVPGLSSFTGWLYL